ncbi:MAG: thiol:disulfide interchange protein, partial [Sulfurovum sp.]|nr:thiol:disulfide interchange protein [Sulfurovum sp.]
MSSLVFGGFTSALKKQKFLEPEEAFKISAVEKEGMIKIKVDLADKIHIYKDDLKFRIVSPQKCDLKPKLPPANDFDGDTVYEKELKVDIPVKEITSKVKGDYTLEVEVVGCSDTGICYQPFRKQFTFKGEAPGVFDKISSLTKEGNTAKIADVLGSESSLFIVVLFFIFGLLLALTPCVFPMIPILSSIIVSQAGDEKPSVAK